MVEVVGAQAGGVAPDPAREAGIRDSLFPEGARPRRPLRPAEVAALEANGCSAAEWALVLVAEPFDPALVRGSRFSGLVRLGPLAPAELRWGGLSLPAGVYDSALDSCDVGEGCAIHRLSYCSRALFGRACLVLDVGQLTAGADAAFGNGAAGKPMRLVNEAGGRELPAFPGILPADAQLWAHAAPDAALLGALGKMTRALLPAKGGSYARIGAGTAIVRAGRIIDSELGPGTVVSGALRVEAVTAMSTAAEPVAIGEGAILEGGVLGAGARALSGAQAERFVLGPRATIERGARLVHSFLGDCSVFAGGEMLHSLVLPFHAQHHASSFLIAAELGGQSNVAAGAVIGSNHSGRANDGELRAGRGFWPGLCVSFKHPSRFASYCLAAKGSYPHEIDLPLPFALLSTSEAALTVAPAWWWTSGAYMLSRSARKFRSRDERLVRGQFVEIDPLAPDTATEILAALPLLERWAGEALAREEARSAGEAAAAGRELLLRDAARADATEILAKGVEKSSRPVRIVKAGGAYRAYREMLERYARAAVAEWMEASPGLRFEEAAAALGGGEGDWSLLGGQPLRIADIAALKRGIASGGLASWEAVHAEYRRLAERYARDKAAHALYVLEALRGKKLGRADWLAELDGALDSQRLLLDRARAGRAKDFSDPFRAALYRDSGEMGAVLGGLDSDASLAALAEEGAALERRVAALRSREG